MIPVARTHDEYSGSVVPGREQGGTNIASFPLLDKGTDSPVYLDSAATTQKPACVIDTIAEYYRTTNANVHRGIYRLSGESTRRYESGRAAVAAFFNAGPSREVIFTQGATGALNLVARGWAENVCTPGDTIILSEMEHHSNIVPWQLLARERDITLHYIPLCRDGTLDMDAFSALLDSRVKIVSITHLSNVLGSINDIRKIISLAHEHGIPVCVDAAQSAAHLPVDMQEMDIDFLAVSAHKMYGPTGIGALIARRELLEQMEPVFGGGDMIASVSLEESTWAEIPWRFEAGTPHVAGVIGWHAALDYIENSGREWIREHEAALTRYAYDRLKALPWVTLYGPAGRRRTGVISFSIDGIHPHDVAQILDTHNVAVRAGHHCAQPLMRVLGVAATVRISFGIYSTTQDIDRCMDALCKTRDFFFHDV